MAAGNARKSIFWIVIAVVVVAVIFPGIAERVLPGWTDKTEPVRALFAHQSTPSGATVGVGQQRVLPAVRVSTKTVEKAPFPLRVTAVGTVQPIASVAIRSRIDAQIAALPVADGADVKKDQLLARLDSSQLEAQIEQAKATLAKDQAQVDQSTRDLARAQDLQKKGAGPQTTVDTAQAALTAVQATVRGDQAQIDNLNVQLSWYRLSSPINGRVGTFNTKVGNIIRSADASTAGVLVIVNQMSPIYVTFAVPQALLSDIRQALTTGGATVTATPQGLDPSQAQTGKIAMIDNAVDSTSGSVTIRATFDNPNEVLWPGQICKIVVNVRTDPDTVAVPVTAVQPGQAGTFVFTIADDTAHYQPVTVARRQDGQAVISAGLNGGEKIALDNQLLLVDGAKVTVAQN